MKFAAIVIFVALLAACAGGESDDIVKLRMTQEFAENQRTFHECTDWARASLGEGASAAAYMELTNSCLTMQKGVNESEADTERREKELEAAKRELAETERKLEAEKQRRDAERQRELEETRRQLEAAQRRQEDEP